MIIILIIKLKKIVSIRFYNLYLDRCYTYEIYYTYEYISGRYTQATKILIIVYRKWVLYVRQDFILFSRSQIILGNCQALRKYLSASLHKLKPFPVEFKGVSFYKHKGTTSRESDKINISPNDKLFRHVSIIFTQSWIHNVI